MNTRTVPPRLQTPRDPTCRNLGDLVALVAALLGTPLIPWQREAAELVTEILPNGRFKHRVVVITVPRQSGKTVLLRALAVTYMLIQYDAEIYYTAQTGKDARARWLQLVNIIRNSPTAASRYYINQSAGSPVLRNKKTRSAFSPFAPTGESLHGYTPMCVMIDEAFAHDEVAGEMLMGAVTPAQQTVKNRQLFVVSTRGTEKSTFLESYIKLGYEGSVCIIDYAAPEGAATYDETTWTRYHPGLGHLTEIDAIRDAALTMSRREFDRAYNNRKSTAGDGLFTDEEWGALGRDDTAQITRGRWVLAIEAAHDLSHACLVASWPHDGGTRTVLLERRPGLSWVPDAARAWSKTGRPAKTLIMRDGPTGDLARTLAETPGVMNLTTLAPADLAAATLSWLQACRLDRTATHIAHPALTRAATTAEIVLSGDGRHLDRRGDRVAPVIAHALAHAYAARLTSDQRPVIALPEAS